CPSLAYGLKSFRDHGCRCHEPSDVRLCSLAAISPASVERSALTIILVGRCYENKTTSQDRSTLTTILAGRCYVNKTTSRPLHYQVLRSLGPTSTKRLAGISATPRVSAGTSTTPRAYSPCRHLFVVLGTSIRAFQEYSMKQRPA
ncbi:hypothetical protein N7467_006921, partial [Penicillium canescens]